MNPPEFPGGGNFPPSSKKELQLQGPRPPPLKVSKESRKIKKPPLPPPAAHHDRGQPALPEPDQQRREPVIIYSLSPRVIHVKPGDFKDLVQRLTGLPPLDEPPAGAEDVSPAARMASVEKTSPPKKERAFSSKDDDMMCMLGEGVEMGQFPGILSPEPVTLPPIPLEFFSPGSDPQTMSFYNEFWSGNRFLPSPSFPSPQSSPDLFNLFD
ncbi:protein MKS1-like [Gastrolobium bilobum]|uniref:protein MKS1-like n=1 Tax=Gastrolobium bilobum TaxID=150636 RepID=UPI002AB1E15A|nr:protein MKS1-like [Gastrolobium bilobum]